MNDYEKVGKPWIFLMFRLGSFGRGPGTYFAWNLFILFKYVCDKGDVRGCSICTGENQ